MLRLDQVFQNIKSIFKDAPTLGIDLDGTIDESAEFFRLLSSVWPGAVIIVTYRKDYEKTVADIKKHGIYTDKIVLVSQLDKSQAILDNKIDVYIDDQDECIKNIPATVTVLKMRNGGNFEDGKWLYSPVTGRLV